MFIFEETFHKKELRHIRNRPPKVVYHMQNKL